MPPDERWLPVASYEGWYEVSDHGRVRSLDRTVDEARGRSVRHKGKLLALQWNTARSGKGYWVIRLYKNSAGETKYVHRMVLDAFVGPCPEGMESRHGPNGSIDNNLSNLSYGTRHQNSLDRVRDGTHNNRSKMFCPYDHKLVTPNLVKFKLEKLNIRSCFACERARNRAYYAKTRGRAIDFKYVADQCYADIMRTVEQSTRTDRSL